MHWVAVLIFVLITSLIQVDPEEQEVVVSPENSDQTAKQDASLGEHDILEALSGFNERAIWKSSKLEKKSEKGASQDKNPKKPDKILSCPRCKSMDTKFFYYNNYKFTMSTRLDTFAKTVKDIGLLVLQ